MSALTHDRGTPEREGKLLVLAMAASATIYAGALVAVDGDGYAVPGSTATGLGDLVLEISEFNTELEEVKN